MLLYRSYTYEETIALLRKERRWCLFFGLLSLLTVACIYAVGLFTIFGGFLFLVLLSFIIGLSSSYAEFQKIKREGEQAFQKIVW